MSIGTGNPQEYAGHTVTNFIPVRIGDVLRIKNLQIISSSSETQVPKVVWYSSSKAVLGGMYGVNGSTNADAYAEKVTTTNSISTYTFALNNAGNQRALSTAAYVRIEGILMDSCTKNDVIITVNEPIE